MPLPNRFTPDFIYKAIREDDDSKPTRKVELEEFYDLRLEIMRDKFFIENDLTTSGKSNLLGEKIISYCNNMEKFYKEAATREKMGKYLVSIDFYTNDFPDEYLNFLSESFRIEGIASKSIQYIIHSLRKELSPSTRHIGSFRRIKKGSIKYIINKYMKIIDEIMDYTGNMEDARIKLIWLINIWNAKSKKEIVNPKYLTIKKVRKKDFQNYFSSFKITTESCRFFYSQNFYPVIKQYLLDTDDEIKITWTNMIENLIETKMGP